jgi:hypothetical protein
MSKKITKKVAQAKTSPKGGQRGCLCKDNKTYSAKCCDGSLQAQGIGQTASVPPQNVTVTETNGVRVTVRQNG